MTIFADNEITVALMLCTVILESVCTGDESKRFNPHTRLICLL